MRVERIGRHANPVVGDGQDDLLDCHIGIRLRRRAVDVRAYHDGATVDESISRVDEEVRYELLDLSTVRADWAVIR